MNNLSNVGQTSITLVMILYFISLTVVWLNEGQELPLDYPNLSNVETYIRQGIQTVIDALENKYKQVHEPFLLKTHLINQKHQAFVCPGTPNDWSTISTCFFHSVDAWIGDAMAYIPSTIAGILADQEKFIRYIFPQHFVLADAIRSIKLLIQRVIPLQNPVSGDLKLGIQEGLGGNKTVSSSVQGFGLSFETFSHDASIVRDMCVSQCDGYSTYVANFLFSPCSDCFPDLYGTSIIPFNLWLSDEIQAPEDFPKETIVYICLSNAVTYVDRDIWHEFGGSCICHGASCATTKYYGFDGCYKAMEAYTGVDCINTNQCTLDFFCPYPEFRFSITKDDNKTTVYTKFDKACNEACAILAGFGSFAELLTLIGTSSVLLPSLFGLLSPSSGGSLLTPASLIPGKQQRISLISTRKDIYSHINNC